ncbi:HD-GYP domain-containing protein [Paenibacillus hodogayensis]|uniref:HD-GYP domain-containing protein n=1 Tax=Paenibacillus hodogayensis TaxID=279208 RepID=A0ABV5VYC4_9BACL
MHKQEQLSFEQLMGKRLVRDLFNNQGVLLIPLATVLNRSHIHVMRDHGLQLSDNDVEEVGPYANVSSALPGLGIDEAAGVVHDVFEQARVSRQIPLAQLRMRVLPLIRESVDRLHLFQLLAALHDKQDYLSRHSVGVGAISMLLGKWIGLPETELLQLTTAAILHDIGKTQIPAELLNKPGRLDDDEFDTMKRHTVIGFEMIRKTVGTTERQAKVALQHHERIDGSGYPLGLKCEQIDPFSRIVAVADVFHAMTSRTVYRNPSPVYAVLKQVEGGAFGAFDPAVVSVLLHKFMQALIGYEVMLTDGTKAKIVLIHPHRQTRPLVQADDTFIDLSQNYALDIEQILANHELPADDRADAAPSGDPGKVTDTIQPPEAG